MAKKKGIDTNTVILIIVVVLLIALAWGVFYKAPVGEAGEGELAQMAGGGGMAGGGDGTPVGKSVKCKTYSDAQGVAVEKYDAATEAHWNQKLTCLIIVDKTSSEYIACEKKLMDLLEKKNSASKAMNLAGALLNACLKGWIECLGL